MGHCPDNFATRHGRRLDSSLGGGKVLCDSNQFSARSTSYSPLFSVATSADSECGRRTDVDASYERMADEITARANIRNVPASSECAVDLVQARLREELKYAALKTARAGVESDRV